MLPLMGGEGLLALELLLAKAALEIRVLVHPHVDLEVRRTAAAPPALLAPKLHIPVGPHLGLLNFSLQ